MASKTKKSKCQMITMSKWRKMKCKSKLNSKTQQVVSQLKSEVGGELLLGWME
jgi:hypothetical protein